MAQERLTGKAAIEYAEAHGLGLSKYEDPTEGAREGLSVGEAREIARVDAALIYVDVPVKVKLSDGRYSTPLSLVPYRVSRFEGNEWVSDVANFDSLQEATEWAAAQVGQKDWSMFFPGDKGERIFYSPGSETDGYSVSEAVES